MSTTDESGVLPNINPPVTTQPYEVAPGEFAVYVASKPAQINAGVTLGVLGAPVTLRLDTTGAPQLYCTATSISPPPYDPLKSTLMELLPCPLTIEAPAGTLHV